MLHALKSRREKVPGGDPRVQLHPGLNVLLKDRPADGITMNIDILGYSLGWDII